MQGPLGALYLGQGKASWNDVAGVIREALLRSGLSLSQVSCVAISLQQAFAAAGAQRHHYTYCQGCHWYGERC